MNRDRLVSAGRAAVHEMRVGYQPRAKPEFMLAGSEIYSQMVEFLEKGKSKGWFLSHDVIVASAIAAIVTGGENASNSFVGENDMFENERQSFIKLAKTKQTLARIKSMLGPGDIIRN